MPLLRGSRAPCLVLALLPVAGCGHAPAKVCFTLPWPRPAEGAPKGEQRVQIAYLGVGGVVIRWQGIAVMTAPSYSNPTLAELALSEIHTDRQLIASLMWHDVRDVRAIVSGHSHYDHLLDVPYVALHRATKADVIGNDAMVKLLRPIEGRLAARAPPNRLVSLEPDRTYHDPRLPIRIRAVVSEHSPSVGPELVERVVPLLAWFITVPEVRFWRGEPEFGRDDLPARAGEWAGGTPLAYVIELLDAATGEVAFRIYYQDSPTRPSWGYPDPPTDGRGYDLAFLTMGGAAEFVRFPRDIVAHLRPRFVMGIHWEDFFGPRKLPIPRQVNRRERIRYLPGVSERRFLRAVRKAQPPGGKALVPCPDAVITFVRRDGRWEIAGQS